MNRTDASLEQEVEEAVDDAPVLEPMALIQAAASGENLADLLSEEELSHIGAEAVRLYRLDRESMSDWLGRMKRGIELATLVKGEKTYPFPRAANVKYPLITTAALQFNARAYPAVVAADAPVKVRVFGADPQGVKAARGERVAAHMSWQLLARIEEWEEETDKLLVQLPIVGTVVRKVWFDPVAARPRCRIIAPGCFVINDKVKSLSDAPRVSEELQLYPDEVRSRVMAGTFRDAKYDDSGATEEAGGEDRSKARTFIEQHCRLDLDRDGYEEPYVVTVHESTGRVARLVGDFSEEDVTWRTERQMQPQQLPTGQVDPFTGQPLTVTMLAPVEVRTGVLAIRRGSYFVPYHFLPSLDGGFLGTGLGVLLGDISETINSIINMMMDAGHMASLGGGFIGSDFRIKGGSQRFSPGEWKTTQSKGQDIRNAIVPMTFPGPDATLFSLLGLLVEAGKEVASVKDVMTGETGGRNMTATTTLALIEQGMTVFTAAYKRIFRAMRAEYRLLARINVGTVSPEEYNAFHDAVGPDGQPAQFDPRQEYGASDMDIMPTADPRSVTRMQEAAKAQVLMELAGNGLVDPAEASKRVLESAAIGDVEALLPKPNPAQQQMEAMTMKAAEIDLMLKGIGIEKALADVEETRSQAVRNMSQADAARVGAALDVMRTRLEAARDGLAALVGGGSGGGGAGAAGVARLAGGPGGPFGAAPRPGGPAGVLPGPMVGGGRPF